MARRLFVRLALVCWLVMSACGGTDADGDGYITCESLQAIAARTDDSSPQPGECDCDDANVSVYPGAAEIPHNYVDENCNGDQDDWDYDGDGYGYSENTTGDPIDCDDIDATIYPGATEVPYDGVDQNCDEQDLVDVDGDGYSPMQGNNDCDDTNASVYVNAPELCDGLDNDCDAKIDDGITKTYYRDADGDYYGDPKNTMASCAGQPTGYVTMAADCNDSDKNIHPYAVEVCDGVDQDCDGQMDEDFDKDTDGYATCRGDCNDTSSYIHPGATEICDRTDEDCDGQLNPDGIVSVFNAAYDWTPANVRANFYSIQEAVDYAYVYTMDVVVCPRTGGHTGFVVGKDASYLSIVGMDLSSSRDHTQPILINHSEKEIVDANGDSHTSGIIIDHAAGDVYISGFEITGISSQLGGGISVIDSNNVGVWWTTVTENSAINGGGIYLHDTSNWTCDYCEITENSASNGGGIYFDGNVGTGPVNEAYIAIHDSVIKNNTADRGEAIYHTGKAGSVTLDAVDIGAVSVEAYYLNNTSTMTYGVAWIQASFVTPNGSVSLASGAKYTWSGEVSEYCRQYGYCAAWTP